MTGAGAGTCAIGCIGATTAAEIVASTVDAGTTVGTLLCRVRTLLTRADCFANGNVSATIDADFAVEIEDAVRETTVLVACSPRTFGALRRTELSSANRLAATCVRINPAAYTASTAAEPRATRLDWPRLLERRDTGVAELDFTSAVERAGSKVHGVFSSYTASLAMLL